MSRIKDLGCTAPDCDRKAKILSEGRPVCNMHYLRWRSNGTFDAREKSPKHCDCICAHCGEPFVRPYRMNATRKAKPQYCSVECFSAELGDRAKVRLGKRFWSKVKIAGENECWEWQGLRHRANYGVFQFAPGRPILAHRVSFMLAKGYLPASEVFICHRCDNPPCVNPKHLWEGDAQSNYDDMVQKGRRVMNPVRGESVATAKLTEAQVKDILSSPLSNVDLGKKFGVTSGAIRLIRIGQNWAHLQEAS